MKCKPEIISVSIELNTPSIESVSPEPETGTVQVTYIKPKAPEIIDILSVV